MPSRQISTSSPSPPNQAQNHHHLRKPLLSSAASGCSVFFLVLLCIRKRTRKRTTPSSDTDSNPPHRFSYAVLRRATNSFSTTTLGHGGFGPVFSGTLGGKPVAVKLMDSASLQGEREFHNELFFATRLQSSHLVVPAIGFVSDPKRRRFMLVYNLMHNGNLHDALLRRKCPELMQWKKRFSVIVDIARGIQFLHSCDPPVIHGDVKPSNILLDHCFEAKIGDFGLARLKTETRVEVEVLGGESDQRRKEEVESNGGSVVEESESVDTGFDDPSPVKMENKGSVVVKDYVIDWIGKEVGKERPKGECVGDGSSSSGARILKEERKKSKKRLEWWESMDAEMGSDGVLKKERRRAAREWWKEEYSEDLAKKKKKKKKKGVEIDDNGDDWWVRDDALHSDLKKSRKNRSRNNVGSSNSWLDGMSGELRRTFSHRNSNDSSGKSGGISISSTQSMRGTVFYVAPEYGYNGEVSEKCDVYSFGVLLLVIISGRRPLQVIGAPLPELQRANLVSWARHCARNGKLIELVDQSIQSLDKDQALLCIKIALLCLLKSPARRPSMKEVVGMLTGELETPQLPSEYLQSKFPFKSRKDAG